MNFRISLYYDHRWVWLVLDDIREYAWGTSPDYDEACRCARIAWEQHSKEGE